MSTFLQDEKTLKKCKIYQMLKKSGRKKHFSFHTPGHKIGRWDITELSYSDNLCAPRGCIAEAERDIAEILGAKKSFLLTDGSTSGVFAMLYAAKLLGVKKIAVCDRSHKSVFNGCELLNLTPLVYTAKEKGKIPYTPTMSALKEEFWGLLEEADALFITSPDYYGNVADLENMRAYCTEKNKPFLIDGAHGGHLHFDKKAYAGSYADLWVDGVHKSLPAFTQGAVVSARTEGFAAALLQGVEVFRTTSPSYPIMASVEYAVKYPRNERLEAAVREYADKHERVRVATDWTKLCAVFGKAAFEVEKELEEKGIYPEFCDGNILTFYLSPATKKAHFEKLKKTLNGLFAKHPLEEENAVQSVPAPLLSTENRATEWVELPFSIGRICAADCGLFPPCTPLIKRGERIKSEKITLLEAAVNVYGLVDGKILVVKGE